MLRNYGMQGIFDKVKGIIFGRPKDYSHEEKKQFNNLIMNIIRDEFKNKDLPVVVDMDFGHTDPKVVLPLGCRVTLNPSTKEIILVESPFI